MSDIKLFHIKDDTISEMLPNVAVSERELHDLVEKGMEQILGIKFLSREHSTGRFHRGYIDSLGLDENNCPVIIEYKRRGNDNVINQALYYLDWLMDHKGDFTLLVKEKLGEDAAASLEFSGVRIICVASSFSRYDERAVRQIGRSIELVRYKFYKDDLLLIELLNNPISLFREAEELRNDDNSESPRAPMPPELRSRLLNMKNETEEIYFALLEFAENIGEDVSIKFLKHYVALNRLKNWCCNKFSGAIFAITFGSKLWKGVNPGNGYQSN